MKLIHVTSQENYESILRDGTMRDGSYWSNSDSISDYYAECILDEDETPVYLEVEVDDLDQNLLEPDHPSISEPIMTALREHHGWGRNIGEEHVWDEWKTKGGTWQDSLDLVGSVIYRLPIPADKLSISEDFSPSPY